MCDHVGILYKGRIVALGEVIDLMNSGDEDLEAVFLESPRKKNQIAWECSHEMAHTLPRFGWMYDKEKTTAKAPKTGGPLQETDIVQTEPQISRFEPIRLGIP